MPLVDASDRTFGRALAADGPALVVFKASWCPPCQRLAPVLERLALAHPGVRVVRVDADRSPRAVAAWRVATLPTVLLVGMQGGRVVGGQNVPATPQALAAVFQRLAPRSVHRKAPAAGGRPARGRKTRKARRNPPHHALADPDDVPARLDARVSAAVPRALAAGARPPLRYVGSGMTADVFRDAAGVAYKVADDHPVARHMVAEEAEWLATAAHVPGVREHVARFYGYRHDLGVIVREHAAQREYYKKNEAKIFDLHRQMGDLMLPFGWSAPEFKVESYAVVPGRGPVLFDASMPHRVGRQLVRYATDVAAGRRPEYSNETLDDVAYAVRNEVRAGTISRAVGGRVLARLKDRGAVTWGQLPEPN